MQERSALPPLGNILMFVVVLVLALVVYPWLMRIWLPPPQAANAPIAQEQNGKKAEGDKKAAANGEKPAADKSAKKTDGEKNKTSVPPVPEKAEMPKAEASGKEAKAPAAKNEPRQWVTLGSVDPDLKKNPYRMLVTLDNEGASVARLELSSERYRDLEDRGGYLGHLVMDDSDTGAGCLVQIVGAGTPAAEAGVKPGDRILKLVNREQTAEIKGPASLESALRKTKPGETVELVIQRGKAPLPNAKVTLIRRPLEVIRPEQSRPQTDWISGGRFDAISWDKNCPPSLLTTLQQVDGEKLRTDEDPNAKMEEELTQQLPGVELRRVNWKTDPKTWKSDPDGTILEVAFRCDVPKYRLKLTKTYTLAKVDVNSAGDVDVDANAYHLVLTLRVTNLDSKPHDVAYRQDGPNGLPVEGAWYATKVQKTGVGLRDIVYQLNHNDFQMVACSELSAKSEGVDKFRKDLVENTQFADDHLPLFFGVDAQYFSAALLPDPKSTASTIDRAVAVRVGEIAVQRPILTNTSFRIIGKAATIKPHESSVASYDLFAGPKRPTLLAKYQMQDLVYYGWPIFHWVAVPMTHILEFFYAMVHNYGLAIMMLTIVVRLSMFPMSRKQAQNAQMMQKIQPEMKEIQKKFKKDAEAARKAQQELWAKHNYNPLSGCLPMFIQMPIFLGLYRALQVDVELRDAPLVSHAIRWCSNLAAPDMLYDWSWFMPADVNNGIGFHGIPLLGAMCGLGPYFNFFPIITLVLFIVQQKVMMPPAVDEQAAQQQKIMKYVMLLMSLMFFKVAAGLCIYFIVSTFWGIAERRFLPKTAPTGGAGGAAGADDDGVPSRIAPKPDRPSSAEREAIRRKKRGGKK